MTTGGTRYIFAQFYYADYHRPTRLAEHHLGS